MREFLVEPLSHQWWVFGRLGSLFSIRLSVFMIPWARKLKNFVKPWNRRSEPPTLGRELATLWTMLDGHSVSTGTNTKIVPVKKPQQRQDLGLLPVATFAGPLDKEMSTLLHHGVRHTQEAVEQEVPDPLMMGHTPPMTWTVNV